MAVVWLSGETLAPDGIVHQLQERFHLKGDPTRVKKQLEEQRKSVTLVVLPDERVKLSEKSLKEMERDIVEADDVENNAKARFVEIFSDCCPALAPDQ